MSLARHRVSIINSQQGRSADGIKVTGSGSDAKCR